MAVSNILRNLIASSATPLRLSLLVSVVPSAAFALPAGLVVQGGSIAVSQPDGSTLVIQQGTDRAAGDWNTFNIAAGERVNIQQPSASSLMLARVTGGAGTEIFGQLNANGGVMLVNPHGVLIGPGGMINTASFSASTLNVDPSRFMQGGPIQMQAQPGAPTDASVINRGTISVANAGLVALLAPRVVNEGEITARLGTIQLASGTAATLDLSDQGLANVVLDANVSGQLINQGQLRAQYVRFGGREGQALVAAAVNLDGLIEARGPADAGGTISVVSGGLGADLKVNGVLDANGGATAKGGTVKLLADRVALLDQARVQASGGTGGGEILIGGNYLGRGPEPNARVAVLTSGAQVKADALNQGNGGRVILWSDEYTGFYGNISARGGVNGGDGGFVETSSKDNLQASGRADAAAPRGANGLWLLDPTDVQIVVPLTGTNGITNTGNVWTPTGATSPATIDRNTIITALHAGTNVEIRTTSGGADPGDITFVAGMNYDNINQSTATAQNATLTLTPTRDVNFNSVISLKKVDILITAARDVTFSTAGQVETRSFTHLNGTRTTSLNVLDTYGPNGISITSPTISLIAPVTTQNDATFGGIGNITLNGTTEVILERRVQAPAFSGQLLSAGTASITTPKLTLLHDGIVADPTTIRATGNLTLTLNGADSTINGKALLASTAGNVLVNGTGVINGVADAVTDNLQLSAPAGTITFNNSLGATTALDTINILNSNGAQFKGAVRTNGAITIANSAANATVSFEDNVTALDLDPQVSVNAYKVSLTGTTNTFTNQVDFLNTGTVTLGNNGTNDTFLFQGGLSFSNNAPAEISALSIKTNGNIINFGTGGITLLGNSAIATNNGGVATGANITLGGPITDGVNTFNLALNAGTAGAITANGSIQINDLTVTGAGSATFNGNLQLNDFITTASNYTVSMFGTTNTFAQEVDFLNTGAAAEVTLGNATADTFTFTGGLKFNTGNAKTVLASTINSALAVHFGNGAMKVKQNSSVTTTSGTAADAAISFGGTIEKDAAAGGQDLTIRAQNSIGNVTFAGAIGGNGNRIGALKVYTGGDTTFNAAVTAESVLTDQPGQAFLNGGTINTSTADGAQILELPIVLGNALSITTTGGGQVILGTNANGASLTSDLNENNNLTITASGNVTINSQVGNLGAGLDPGDITINTSNGSSTTFNKSIQASSIVTNQDGTANLNGGTITATNTTNTNFGVQILENTINLGANLAITSTVAGNAGGTAVTLGTQGAAGTLDSTVGGVKTLTITSPNVADVKLNAAIGSTRELGDIQVNTGGNTAFNNTVKAVSVTTDQPGTATLASTITTSGAGGVNIQENGANAVTLTGPVTITTTGGGNVAFAGPINSQANTSNNLTINSAGNITTNGIIGGTTPLGNIVMTATDLNLNANITTVNYGNPSATNGNQTYTGNLNPNQNVTFQGNVGTLNGVRYGDGSQVLPNGKTWTYKFNAPAQAAAGGTTTTAAASTPRVAPDVAGNLLRYQLSENDAATAPETTTDPGGGITTQTVDDKVCSDPNGCTSNDG